MTWTSWLNQPTAQIYHLSVDYRFPYWVTGAQQDSGAIAVRSRGKFAHMSRRISAISSSDGAVLTSAHNPYRDRDGPGSDFE